MNINKRGFRVGDIVEHFKIIPSTRENGVIDFTYVPMVITDIKVENCPHMKEETEYIHLEEKSTGYTTKALRQYIGARRTGRK